MAALELIGVQSRGYLEEDNIVRFEDVYGRAKSSLALRADLIKFLLKF